jgi:hypothetical protein
MIAPFSALGRTLSPAATSRHAGTISWPSRSALSIAWCSTVIADINVNASLSVAFFRSAMPIVSRNA